MPQRRLHTSIACGYCSNIAPMDVVGMVDHDYNSKDGIPQGSSYGYYYYVAICPACSRTNICRSEYDERAGEDDQRLEVIYPQDDEVPNGLPEHIKSSYMAAEKVRPIDANAYAILMRRLLEQVCLDNGATGGTLASMLNDLCKRNEIPMKLVQVAKGLRDFGNMGAHAGLGTLSEREVPIVSALCRAILEYVYSAPFLASLAEEKLRVMKKTGEVSA